LTPDEGIFQKREKENRLKERGPSFFNCRGWGLNIRGKQGRKVRGVRPVTKAHGKKTKDSRSNPSTTKMTGGGVKALGKL